MKSAQISSAAVLIAASLMLAGCKTDAATPPAASSTGVKAMASGAGMEDMVKTASGLGYRDVKVGTGAVAQAGNSVSVHYTGWLQNPDGSAGTKFDSSRDSGKPFQFTLGAGNVIKGWDEGVQGMKVGGQRRLVIPAALGYGQRGAGGVIPPGATLLFDVELLGV